MRNVHRARAWLAFTASGRYRCLVYVIFLSVIPGSSSAAQGVVCQLNVDYGEVCDCKS
jgi:hypothetical protein